MPLFRNLTKNESEALLHKIRNSGRKAGDNITDSLLSEMTF
jgi:hypothetical protein